MIGVPNGMMILDAVKFPFQFSDLSAICVQLLASAGPVLVDLVDDPDRINEHHEELDTKFNGDTEVVKDASYSAVLLEARKWIRST